MALIGEELDVSPSTTSTAEKKDDATPDDKEKEKDKDSSTKDSFFPAPDTDLICGAVVSLRSKVDRIQIWTRSKTDVERLNSIGKRLVKLLDVSEADNIGLEFQYNSGDRFEGVPNKFLSIQSLPATGFRGSFGGDRGHAAGHNRTTSVGTSSPLATEGGFGSGVSAPNSAQPGGAFGAFGVGGIGGGGVWRGKR